MGKSHYKWECSIALLDITEGDHILPLSHQHPPPGAWTLEPGMLHICLEMIGPLDRWHARGAKKQQGSVQTPLMLIKQCHAYHGGKKSPL